MRYQVRCGGAARAGFRKGPALGAAQRLGRCWARDFAPASDGVEFLGGPTDCVLPHCCSAQFQRHSWPATPRNITAAACSSRLNWPQTHLATTLSLWLAGSLRNKHSSRSVPACTCPALPALPCAPAEHVCSGFTGAHKVCGPLSADRWLLAHARAAVVLVDRRDVVQSAPFQRLEHRPSHRARTSAAVLGCVAAAATASRARSDLRRGLARLGASRRTWLLRVEPGRGAAPRRPSRSPCRSEADPKPSPPHTAAPSKHSQTHAVDVTGHQLHPTGYPRSRQATF